MITVEEAQQAILNHLHKPITTEVALDKCIGKVLAEAIVADRDFPPFDRVTMDGIAISFEQWKNGTLQFPIEKTHAAGEPQIQLGNPANAVEVMTGATLPKGTDTVVRYEDLTIQNNIARINASEITIGQSVHRQGSDEKKGNVLIEPGLLLSPAEVALLATVGKANLIVYQFPKAAIIASGDELVPVDSSPLPHQIRRSNTLAIQSAMHQMGWPANQYHIADDESQLEESLARLLCENDVLILSGGVSKGKFDYIPAVLEKLGVRKVFHEVSQRPGKPLWFGAANGKQVFALPGNPVSTFMCFYKYIKPWVLASLKSPKTENVAILAKDFTFTPKLTYFLQVRVRNEAGRLLAYPDQGGGSGDFANLKKIDGFLELPQEKNEFKAGEVFPYIPFRL
jgi:molybdopterin molybdotransferase